MALAVLNFCTLILALILALSSQVQAAPNIRWPLSAQQPPVARIGQDFLFDVLPGSFNSSADIVYTTSALPAWLAFDAPVLTFYGTPEASDVGQMDITLIATDASGSTQSTWTLLVTNYTSPAVHQSFQTQIASPRLHNFGSAVALANNTGVKIPPYWSFSLGFQFETFRVSRFDPINGELFFQTHLRGAAGMPPWLAFNNQTFTFSGVAPADGSYTIVATGTDFWGYTAAQTSFVIEVGEGDGVELGRRDSFPELKTIARDRVEYAIPLDGVLVGGEMVQPSALDVLADLTNFPWLSLDT
jgi:axial budding pattern protein 2